MTHTYAFQGHTNTPDSFDDWANSVSMEITEGTVPDETYPVPLVLVDTNYKPSRTGAHPVRLTVLDALKASAALISLSQNSIENCWESFDESHSDDDVLGMLEQLAEVDSVVWDLRTFLHRELRDRREQAKDQPADEQPAAGEGTENAPASAAAVFADDLAEAAEAEKGGK